MSTVGLSFRDIARNSTEALRRLALAHHREHSAEPLTACAAELCRDAIHAIREHAIATGLGSEPLLEHDCERNGCAKDLEDHCNAEADGYGCTLALGHDGAHRACSGDAIVHGWPATESAPDEICRVCGTFRAACTCPLDVEPEAAESPSVRCARCGDAMEADETNCCCDDDGTHEDCGHEDTSPEPESDRCVDDRGHMWSSDDRCVSCGADGRA